MKFYINCFRISLTIAILFLTSTCHAQGGSDSLNYFIETHDGNTYTGSILKQNSDTLWLQSEKLGVINILKTDIRKMTPVDQEKIKEGKYWFDNPQATRYFFSPNAYGLKKGEGYYQNVWVLVNSFSVGLTDYLSVGGGLMPFFLFAGSPTPVWFTPKLSIPIARDKVGLGAGALLGTVIGESETSFGILYGISTFGSKDKNVSLGLGYGFAGGSWAQSPMINLNAMIRVGARGYLLTENYFIRSEGSTVAMLMLGGRQIIKYAGLDYGLFIPVYSDIDTFFALPWLGLTIPFGHKKEKNE